MAQVMLRRIIGALLLLAGATAIVIAALMLGTDNPLTPPRSAGDAQAQQWLLHWRSWALAQLILGAATVVAGVGVLLRRQWGLLLLLLVALVSLLAPWLVSAIGWVRYEYERPTIWESVVFAAIGVAALTGLLRRGHRDSGN
jgi:hypothetical protein